MSTENPIDRVEQVANRTLLLVQGMEREIGRLDAKIDGLYKIIQIGPQGDGLGLQAKVTINTDKLSEIKNEISSLKSDKNKTVESITSSRAMIIVAMIGGFSGLVSTVIAILFKLVGDGA